MKSCLEKDLEYYCDRNQEKYPLYLDYTYKFRNLVAPNDTNADDPYQQLAIGIVNQAISDFLNYAKYLEIIPESERSYWIRTFSSEWFELLSGVDGNVLYSALWDTLQQKRAQNRWILSYWMKQFA